MCLACSTFDIIMEPLQLTLLATSAWLVLIFYQLASAGNDLSADHGRGACGHRRWCGAPAVAAAGPAPSRHRRRLGGLPRSLGGNRAEPLCVPGLAAAPRWITARPSAWGSRELQFGPRCAQTVFPWACARCGHEVMCRQLHNTQMHAKYLLQGR